MSKVGDVLGRTRKRAWETFKRWKNWLGGGVIAGAGIYVLNAVLSNAISNTLISQWNSLKDQSIGAFGLFWFGAILVIVLGIIVHAYIMSYREARKKPVRVGMEERLVVDQLRRLYNEAGWLASSEILYLTSTCSILLAHRNRLAPLLARRHDEFQEHTRSFKKNVVDNVYCSLPNAQKQFRQLHIDYLSLCDLFHGIADDEIQTNEGFDGAYEEWKVKHRAYVTELKGLLLGSVFHNMRVDLQTDFTFRDPREEALREKEERDAIRARFASDSSEKTDVE